MHDKRYCKNLGPIDICDMCVEKKYFLDFCCIKFCFEEMLVKLKIMWQHWKVTFKKITKYESLFFWSNFNIIRSSLDNPHYYIM